MRGVLGVLLLFHLKIKHDFINWLSPVLKVLINTLNELYRRYAKPILTLLYRIDITYIKCYGCDLSFGRLKIEK